MCVIFKIDLRCCEGCREGVCKDLKRVKGVEQVKVGEDETTIMVCGKGFDEAEIVWRAKKRKRKVEVVSRVFHNATPLPDIDAGLPQRVEGGGVQPVERSGVQPQPQPQPQPPILKPKTKPRLSDGEEVQPKPRLSNGEEVQPKPKLADGEQPQQQQQQQEEESNSPRKQDTLVTERAYPECEGRKIRTRVTTSQDGCSCIRVEETHFIINKQGHAFLVNALTAY